jgi:hypothetical protein
MDFVEFKTSKRNSTDTMKEKTITKNVISYQMEEKACTRNTPQDTVIEIKEKTRLRKYLQSTGNTTRDH